jgi:hypothetical protein
MMSGSIGIPSVHPENFSQLHERGLIPRGEIYSSSFLFFSFQKKKLSVKYGMDFFSVQF